MKGIEMKKLILGILMLAMCGNSLVYQAGEKYTSENVKANRIDVYREYFVGGYVAGAFVSGDGDTDLDLYIYDEFDNLICSSTTYGDDEGCTWIPNGTRKFTIKIKNVGNISNNYNLILN